MFDRLVEVLLEFLDLFKVITVINEWERGLVLRMGKKHRELEPGWHWVAPFAIEHVLAEHTVVTTTNLLPQSLTTKDGHSITLAGIVTWQVTDVSKALLEVEGRQEVILDATYGVIARHVSRTTWDELRGKDVAHEVTKEVRRKAARYGFSVESVQFSDLVRCRSIRLWNQPHAQG